MYWFIIFQVRFVASNPIVPLIVGGRSVNITRYPYHIALEYDGDSFCSGSIVTPSKVLTAAHCVVAFDRQRMRVRVGTGLRGTGGQLLNVSKVDSHPLYKASTQDYDLSILTLSGSVKLGVNAKPVELPPKDLATRVGDRAVVTGWGHLHQHAANRPRQLHAVEVVATDQSACRRTYALRHRKLTKRMVCYSFPGGGKDACHGDSGGPLVSGGIQIGIVSWGVGCANADFPGVYTKVANLRDYIDAHLIS